MPEVGSEGTMDSDFRKKRMQQLRDLELQGIDPFTNEEQAAPEAPRPTASSETTEGLAALAEEFFSAPPAPAPAPPPLSGVLEIDRTITIPLAMPLSAWERMIRALDEEDVTDIADAIRARLAEEAER